VQVRRAKAVTDVVTPRNQVRPKKELLRRAPVRKALPKRVSPRRALRKRVPVKKVERPKKAVAVPARRVVFGVEAVAKRAVVVPRKRVLRKRVLHKRALRKRVPGKRVEKAIVVAGPGVRFLLVSM